MATRTERIEARIDPKVREKIQKAAALEGMSTSAFIVGAAADRADRILGRWHVTVVSDELFEELLADLDTPPEPNPALARAAARARRIVTRR